jgi:hypothetical protein
MDQGLVATHIVHSHLSSAATHIVGSLLSSILMQIAGSSPLSDHSRHCLCLSVAGYHGAANHPLQVDFCCQVLD